MIIKKFYLCIFEIFFQDNFKPSKLMQHLIREMEAEGVLDSQEVEGEIQNTENKFFLLDFPMK